MDKILRRVRMAERNVARRTKRQKYIVDGGNRRADIRGTAQTRGHAGAELGAAIKARHEELELGPLAPKRDVFKPDKLANYWGAISTDRATLTTPITDAQLDARCAWAGGSKLLCLARGDRVVVTEGPYKGQISTISLIIKTSMSVELEGNLGLTNVQVPSYMLQDGQTTIQQVKSYFPISSVRLVHPIEDPATGTTRDVIIRELKPVRVKHDRPTRKVFFSRVVPGLNVQIPWPKVAPNQRENHAFDTLRLEVEERTFVPTLLRPPMPETVLDELRNRYSKFRTRHTPEYIAEVEAREAEKKARRKGARVDEMLLPVQEYNRKMREQRRERGAPELSEEMLEKIGEVIAKNKLARSQGAVTPAPAEAEVDKLQKAVEELSLGGDVQGTTGGEQPRP
jgi:large subunit ribosomal protein L24